MKQEQEGGRKVEGGKVDIGWRKLSKSIIISQFIYGAEIMNTFSVYHK